MARNHIRICATVFLFASFGAVAIIVGFRHLCDVFLESGSPRSYRDKMASVAEEFARVTGIVWPTSAHVIVSEDTHGGFNGDGRLCIALRVQRQVVDSWMKTPPWGAEEWLCGPVPTEIGVNCGLPSKKVWIMSIADGIEEYQGDPELKRLLSSHDIQFVAYARGSAGMMWHNGSVLIVDQRNSLVWLFVWDM